jgi:hypothetical protein
MSNHPERQYKFRRPRGFAPPSVEEVEQKKQQRYEHAVVKRLIDRTGVEHRKDSGFENLRRNMWNRQQLNCGFGRLAFRDFQQVTRFPMWLETRRIRDDQQVSLEKLLSEFHRTPLYTAFREAEEIAATKMDGGPFGVVFSTPAIKFMSLHTWPSRVQAGVTRIEIADIVDGSVAIIEEFDHLIEAIGQNVPLLCRD